MSKRRWQYFERLIEAEAEVNGYKAKTQVPFGFHPDGRRRRLDALLFKDRAVSTDRIAVSARFQGGPGSCQDKIVLEVISLTQACLDGLCHRAYVVLGGDGWSQKLKQWYLNQGPQSYIPNALVRIKTVDIDIFRRLLRDGNL